MKLGEKKSPHEFVIFIKFYKDRTKNEDFLLMANFGTYLISFDPDFMYFVYLDFKYLIVFKISLTLLLELVEGIQLLNDEFFVCMLWLNSFLHQHFL